MQASLEFLMWLEQFRCGATNAFFVAMSALGDERAYLALLAIIYLCVDQRFGFRVLVMFMVTAYCNSQLKDLYDTQRPYQAFPAEMHPIWAGSGPGHSFPSGHSQNAATVWGMIATGVRSWWARIGIIALILLIGVSRLFLQVHWPVDVVGGLLIGGFLLGMYFVAQKAWTFTLIRAEWALVAFAAALAMFVLGFPRYGCVTTSGALLGAAWGYLLLGPGYCPKAPLRTQVVKAAIALGALLVLRESGKALLGDGPWAMGGLHLVLGFLAAYVLPALYMKLGWARAAETDAEGDCE